MILLFLSIALTPFSHSEEETLLFKDPLNKEPIVNPAGRATGSLANEIGYHFFINEPSLEKNDTSNLTIKQDQGICWSQNITNTGKSNPSDEAPHERGGINFVAANNSKQLFNWGPHLAGKRYIIRFTSIRAIAQPLSFGIRDNDSLEGSWAIVENRRYYLAFVNFAQLLIVDHYNRYVNNLPMNRLADGELNREGTTPQVFGEKGPYRWKIDVDETTETVHVFINDEEKQVMKEVQALGNDRYFHFFYAKFFDGTLSDFSVSLVATLSN